MPRGLQFFLYAALAAVPAAFLTFNVLSKQTVDCEVCMSYAGMKKCRTAQAPTKEECQRTATDNACAYLSSGMTESMKCTSATPDSVKF